MCTCSKYTNLFIRLSEYQSPFVIGWLFGIPWVIGQIMWACQWHLWTETKDSQHVSVKEFVVKISSFSCGSHLFLYISSINMYIYIYLYTTQKRNILHQKNTHSNYPFISGILWISLPNFSEHLFSVKLSSWKIDQQMIDFHPRPPQKKQGICIYIYKYIIICIYIYIVGTQRTPPPNK